VQIYEGLAGLVLLGDGPEHGIDPADLDGVLRERRQPSSQRNLQFALLDLAGAGISSGRGAHSRLSWQKLWRWQDAQNIFDIIQLDQGSLTKLIGDISEAAVIGHQEDFLSLLLNEGLGRNLVGKVHKVGKGRPEVTFLGVPF